MYRKKFVVLIFAWIFLLNSVTFAQSEEDFPEQVWGGYFGIKRSSTSEIYPMYRNGNSLHISNGSGVRYDLSDPSKNKDAADMNSDDFSDCYAWWEVPGIEGNTFNVVSASMSAFDIRSTEKQLSDFVPYFEYDFDIFSGCADNIFHRANSSFTKTIE